jgi:hypothetical protein
MCTPVKDDGACMSESQLMALMCFVSRNVFLVIVFKARFMELYDTMFPHVGIPYSRWCNLGGVILYPGVMDLGGLFISVGLLIGFDLIPDRASKNPYREGLLTNDHLDGFHQDSHLYGFPFTFPW